MIRNAAIKALLFKNMFRKTTLSPAMIDNIRKQNPGQQYAGFEACIKQQQQNVTNIIHDPQLNLKFLVEKSGFPGCSDLGICINLGYQDENQVNAGSLDYLKNFVHMKETRQQIIQNYDFFQQSGAISNIQYDHTFTYVKCSFFSEDAETMVDLILDLAIKQKQMFQDTSKMITESKDIVDLVRRTAFGHRGLGMPKSGVGNILTNSEFMKFQSNITPYNTLFSIANYPNQEELINLFKHKIKTKYPDFLKRSPFQRIQSAYIGGYEQFKSDDQHFFQFGLAYEGVPLNSANFELIHVIKTILGNASSFSSGGPGKGMHSRCTKNLLNRVPCVEKAACIMETYLSHGLFGLTVSGPQQDHQQVINCTIQEFKKLKTLVPQESLERAKNILVNTIYTNIERQSDRLEQMSKHVYAYDRIRLFEYEHKIRQITSSQIQDFITQLMKTRPTIVVSGTEQSVAKSLTHHKILKKLNS